MGTLWSRGPSTVAEVKAELEEQDELDYAYTTVLSLLQRLQSKGWVKALKNGKAHRYAAAQSLASARDAWLTRIRYLLFDGSYDLMLHHIVADHHLKRVVIARMRRILDRRLIEIANDQAVVAVQCGTRLVPHRAGRDAGSCR
jgi:predicted transcriptional regulator